MVCTKLFSGLFENESGGGKNGTHDGRLGFRYYGLRRKIGRRMPTIGIRGTDLVWVIKAIKRRSNSLNKLPT
jgi:hypothetical protein